MFVLKRGVSDNGSGSANMSRCNQGIVYEGWLTKSPPSKRIWRAKWRRRWFVLRNSGELPGQYRLEYYSDRNCRKVKGTVNLDLCQQVDAGLCMDNDNAARINPMLRGSVFSIRTNARIYHLVAECVSEMEHWVESICRVCGLKVAEETAFGCRRSVTIPEVADTTTSSVSSGPYIPISECRTGSPISEQPTSPQTFTFDTNAIMRELGPAVTNKPRSYTRSYINPNSNECTNARQLNGGGKSRPHGGAIPRDPQWNTINSFTRLSVSNRPFLPNENYVNTASLKPPRPPKPPHLAADLKEAVVQKDTFVGPPMCEPVEFIPPFIAPKDMTHSDVAEARKDSPYMLVLPPHALYSNASPHPPNTDVTVSYSSQDETKASIYMNMMSLTKPPVVDRTLKPGRFRAGAFNKYGDPQYSPSGNFNSNKLQYLDLDLDHNSDKPVRRPAHGKSRSNVDTRTIYNTVDFMKTEALNMTRQDAEASRKGLMNLI